MRLAPLLEAANNPLEINNEALELFAEKLEDITLPQALLKERAGPRHIAKTVSDIMHNGASDGVRLRAAEMAAGMAGLDKGREASHISINIQGDNVQLNQLFCPTR